MVKQLSRPKKAQSRRSTRQVSRVRVSKTSTKVKTPHQYSPRQKTTRLTARSSQRRRKPSRPVSGFTKLLLYLLRLAILGVGISAIGGTTLHILDSSKHVSAVAEEQSQEEVTTNPLDSNSGSILVLGEEMLSLKSRLLQLAEKMPQLEPKVFLVDLDNGAYLDIEADSPTAAASTIKIPILVAFFQDVDAGRIRLDENLTMGKDVIAGGSGNMRYYKPGTKFTALETATRMISISDNTATNMLIKRLGGKNRLNQIFRQWGLKQTVIRNALPDLTGTNTTSSKDLGSLLAMVNQGELVFLRSRDRLLRIMRTTKTKTLLPPGLESKAAIAHKTGDIGSILADAGIVDMPSGKRYIVAVMVKRPHNDYSARTLIQRISRTIYQNLKLVPLIEKRTLTSHQIALKEDRS